MTKALPKKTKKTTKAKTLPQSENGQEKADKIIETTLKELLEKLKVAASVVVTEESEDHYKVNIETDETGLLIGYHGETINSLQLLLGVILYKKTGKWIHVVLDVGDYREMRESSIKEMVNRIVGEVEQTQVPVALPYLTPLERRIVHMMLSDNKTVVSESSGEGKERRVMIKPR